MEVTKKRFVSDIETALFSPAVGYTKGTGGYDMNPSLCVNTLRKVITVPF